MDVAHYIWIFLSLVVVFSLTYLFMKKYHTVPWYPIGKYEGFSGAVGGVGNVDCLHTLQGAAEILSIFEQSGVESVEEGPRDYSELRLLLSKLACMKKDLMGASGIIHATLYQPYSTTHDREPVAETVARCFAKTIPVRELDISFETWQSRGKELLRRLCTAAKLTEAIARKQEETFSRVWSDVYNVAKGACLQGEPLIAGKPASPRDPLPYTPNSITDLDKYEGYF